MMECNGNVNDSGSSTAVHHVVVKRERMMKDEG